MSIPYDALAMNEQIQPHRARSCPGDGGACHAIPRGIAVREVSILCESMMYLNFIINTMKTKKHGYTSYIIGCIYIYVFMCIYKLEIYVYTFQFIYSCMAAFTFRDLRVYILRLVR